MRTQETRERPKPWRERRARVKHVWLVPFVAFEYAMEWAAYALGHWALLEVLEYLGSFGVLVAVIFYFSESGDRVKQKHYQAWLVINSAQGKGGNGGRVEALEELNTDGVKLVGVDLSSAFLQGIQLQRAHLVRANMDGADARQADLQFARLEDASLQGTNLREANLTGVTLQGSTLDGADLTGAQLRDADLTAASLSDTDLQGADLQGVKWQQLRSIKGANIYGIKNAPAGFLDWARAHGAIQNNESQ
jgi:Pentapeptide repeats (8 copies)